ncbi:MAG: macrolide ABC transporter ATP-binding protein [Clostridiales bacterium 43-6]|nr:MAG: macrolide ABC transporter ATP-binding protein [Clostridiales bacterium 43-6]
MERLIDIRKVYKIYNRGENEVRALDGITLSIQEGEFVAITGHSGSGKSTLMNILGCLDCPDEGSYVLCRHDVSKLSDNKLSQIRNCMIGFIFQSFHLISSLSALENVELPLLYRGINKEKRRQMATEALTKVGLYDRMHHKPFEMSGGQQQRVAIARAIAGSPPVILADEPTGNLDTKVGDEVIQLLYRLNNEGKTIILITHDREIAAKAARMIKIIDGKIVEDM